jgi:hypothetical protein
MTNHNNQQQTLRTTCELHLLLCDMRAICWNGAATTSNNSSTLQAFQRTYHVFLSRSLARLARSFLHHQTTRLRFFGGICSRNQRAWSKRESRIRRRQTEVRAGFDKCRHDVHKNTDVWLLISNASARYRCVYSEVMRRRHLQWRKERPRDAKCRK